MAGVRRSPVVHHASSDLYFLAATARLRADLVCVAAMRRSCGRAGASSEKGKQEVSSDQTIGDASARGVQDPEREHEPPPRPLESSYESTTDALDLFLREVGRRQLLKDVLPALGCDRGARRRRARHRGKHRIETLIVLAARTRRPQPSPPVPPTAGAGSGTAPAPEPPDRSTEEAPPS
jgi:hypothetical protein